MDLRIVTAECTCKNNPGLVKPEDLFFYDNKQRDDAIKRHFGYKSNHMNFILNGKWLHKECLYWAVHFNNEHIMRIY